MKLTITASTIFFLLLSNSANAKDFQIGKVHKLLQIDSICVINLPKGKDAMVLVDRGSDYAFVNINGKDIKLKRISTQVIKPSKRGISKYHDGIITVTLDSTIIRTIKGELDRDELLEKVTFKVGNTSKTVQTNGYCL